jgi:hypothetical protein
MSGNYKKMKGYAASMITYFTSAGAQPFCLKEGASKVKVGVCGQASLKRSPSFLMRPRLKWLKP